jgi:hypothetical protein
LRIKPKVFTSLAAILLLAAGAYAMPGAYAASLAKAQISVRILERSGDLFEEGETIVFRFSNGEAYDPDLESRVRMAFEPELFLSLEGIEDGGKALELLAKAGALSVSCAPAGSLEAWEEAAASSPNGLGLRCVIGPGELAELAVSLKLDAARVPGFFESAQAEGVSVSSAYGLGVKVKAKAYPVAVK